MSGSTRRWLARSGDRGRRLAAIGTVLALVACVGLFLLHRSGERSASAYFSKAVGIYPGDDVVVLGVKVGTVTAITPEPDRVKVEFTYNRPVPADVKAVITTPSLVPVRSLTLSPVYDGGPKLSDGASIPLSRTAVPVEWDEVKTQFDELATALGPNGTNAKGALGRALSVAADNLRGNGADIGQTVSALSEAMSTLADNRGEVFATVRNLEVFVSALNASSDTITDFNRNLASVSGTLSSSADEIDRALRSTSEALSSMTTFLRENSGAIQRATREARPLAELLAENRESLATVLHAAPTAVSNIYGLYDPLTGALTAQLAFANLQTPATVLCSMIQGLGGTTANCHDALSPLLSFAGQSLDFPLGFDPVQRNGRSNQVTARPGPEPDAGTPDARPDLSSLMTPGSAP